MKVEKEQSLDHPDLSEDTQTGVVIKRPKRNVMQKSLEYNNGLLWREEKELKKALYASLQENKRRISESEGDASDFISSSVKDIKKRKKEPSVNGDVSDDSPQASPKRTKVHAQRKFAQGSNPNSPAPTPIKFRSNSVPAVDILPARRPKTEDFLTFLCLRSTTILPPSLDFFSLATRSDISSDSRCQSPVNSDIGEKQKTPSKNGNKTPLKNGKSHKSLRHGPKKFRDKDEGSESDFMESDSDDEVLQKPDRGKPAGDSSKKNGDVTAKSVGGSVSSGTSGKGKPVTGVQALKQKYKQQRLDKQKKVLAQTKKNIDSSSSKEKTSKQLSNVKTDLETVPHTRRSKSIRLDKEMKPNKTKTLNEISKKDHFTKSSKITRQSKPNKTIMKSLRLRKGGLAVVAKPNFPQKKMEVKSRPLTRNLTIMTRSLKEELDKAAFEASKRASENERDTKVASKTSKFRSGKKSLNSGNSLNKSSKLSKKAKVTLQPRTTRSSTRNMSSKMSDFSSDDDEPLAKKIKINSNYIKSTMKFKHKRDRKFGNKSKLSQPIARKLRSSAAENSGHKHKSESSDSKGLPGRPSRKTKEAANVYLELLGKKLSSSEIFGEDTKRKKILRKAREMKMLRKKSKLNREKISQKIHKTRHSLLSSRSLPTISNPKTRAQKEESAKLLAKSKEKLNQKQNSSPVVGSVTRKKIRDSLKSASSLERTTRDKKKYIDKIDDDDDDDYNPESEIEVKKKKKFNLHSLKKNKLMSATTHKKVNKTDSPKLAKASKLSENHEQKKESKKEETKHVKKEIKEKDKASVQKPSKTKQEETESSKKEKKSENESDTKEKPLNKKQPDNNKSLTKAKDIKKEKSEKEIKNKEPKQLPPSPKKEATPTKNDDKKFGYLSRVKLLKELEGPPILNDDLCEGMSFVSKDDDSRFNLDVNDLFDGSVHVGECTSIAVKENVSSNSVAIQVNLVDDMSEFEDDLLDFAGSEFGSENSLSIERILTPTCFLEHSSSTSNSKPCVELPASSNTNETPKTKKPLEVAENKSSTHSSPAGSPLKAKPKASTVQSSPQTSTPASPDTPPAKKRGRPPGKRPRPDSIPSCKLQPLPKDGEPALLVEAPTYNPTLEEFQDPLEYIEKILPEAEKYGICRIIPPPTFKPECKVNDDMRFTAHNQYIHKMLQRFGSCVLHMCCIKKHLESQGGNLEQAPLIGGMELDLTRLSQLVESYGGIKEVVEKKKWQKIADTMRIPKSAQDRVTKLYDAYCKYLLSYSMLTKDERQKLEQQVVAERQRKKNRNVTEVDECVTKGRSMCLSSFFRIARNTMSMWFKHEPTPEEVEADYWKFVTERQHHVCVHAGNVDSSVYGYGFPCNKSSPFARHPWNLKVLTNNPGSILRSMGPVMGVTIPTLHVGMLFTTGCWYRDPHCLPWIEYLHTGASKIWYGVPASHSEQFRNAMKQIVPEYCPNNPIWLPSDTAMVPPNMLAEHGSSLCRVIQDSGQFVLVFPKAFTSTICCGYTVSESVYFARPDWLKIAETAFKEIRESCEPAVFSLERLLFCVASDPRTNPDVLKQIKPMIENIRENELSLRKMLFDLGLKVSERVPHVDVKDARKRKSHGAEEEQEYECEVCRANCYISAIIHPQEDVVYCLTHAIEHFQKKKRDLKFFKLIYTYDQAELNEIVQKLNDRINLNNQKKNICKKLPKKKSP